MPRIGFNEARIVSSILIGDWLRPISQVANSGLSLPQFSGPALPSYSQCGLCASALACLDLSSLVFAASGLASGALTAGSAGASASGSGLASGRLGWQLGWRTWFCWLIG